MSRHTKTSASTDKGLRIVRHQQLHLAVVGTNEMRQRLVYCHRLCASVGVSRHESAMHVAHNQRLATSINTRVRLTVVNVIKCNSLHRLRGSVQSLVTVNPLRVSTPLLRKTAIRAVSSRWKMSFIMLLPRHVVVRSITIVIFIVIVNGVAVIVVTLLVVEADLL